MNMYKKLNCVCNHGFDCHIFEPEYEQQGFCGKGICNCLSYDPTGHNPELENVLCPKCRLARMERSKDSIYYCVVCNFILFERQVMEMTG